MKKQFFPDQEWQARWALCPFKEKAQLYLAVSGGADSMALLNTACLFARSPHFPLVTSLCVLHFNHGIRKKEGDLDESLVEDFCKKKGIPFFSGRADIPALSKAGKVSLELAGRKARYDFFRRTMEAHKMPGARPVLVTAHHRGDQAETLLLHLIRGAGMDGLSGMRVWAKGLLGPSESYLFRPFLFLPKDSLVNWCKDHSIPYREDQTNWDLTYRRNFVRLKILTAAREINPSAEEALSQTSTILQEEGDFLDHLTEEAMGKCLFDGRKIPPAEVLSYGHKRAFLLKRNACLAQGLAISQEPFSYLAPVIQRRVLRKILLQAGKKAEGPRFEEIEKIRGLPGQSAGKWIEVCGMIFLCDFQGLLVFSADKKQAFSMPIEEEKRLDISSLTGIRELDWPAFQGRIFLRFLDCPPNPEKLNNLRFCYLNPQGIGTLEIRTMGGQTPFEKFGGGKKPLRRLMNEWHIPNLMRRNYPVLWDGESILWAPWAGRSRKRLIQEGKPILEVEWRQRWTKD